MVAAAPPFTYMLTKTSDPSTFYFGLVRPRLNPQRPSDKSWRPGGVQIVQTHARNVTLVSPFVSKVSKTHGGWKVTLSADALDAGYKTINQYYRDEGDALGEQRWQQFLRCTVDDEWGDAVPWSLRKFLDKYGPRSVKELQALSKVAARTNDDPFADLAPAGPAKPAFIADAEALDETVAPDTAADELANVLRNSRYKKDATDALGMPWKKITALAKDHKLDADALLNTAVA